MNTTLSIGRFRKIEFHLKFSEFGCEIPLGCLKRHSTETGILRICQFGSKKYLRLFILYIIRPRGFCSPAEGDLRRESPT